MSNISGIDPKIKGLLHNYYNDVDVDDAMLLRNREKALASLGHASKATNVIEFTQRRSRVWDLLTAGTAAAVLAGGVWVAQLSTSEVDKPFDPHASMVSQGFSGSAISGDIVDVSTNGNIRPKTGTIDAKTGFAPVFVGTGPNCNSPESRVRP